MKCDALIYVIDSSDRERLEESQKELEELLKCEYLVNAKVLIYANKQDMENSIGEKDLYEKLRLKYDTHVHRVMPCSATRGDGINEGLEWLAKNL
jgi:signal recognition particle receptor subunit beta